MLDYEISQSNIFENKKISEEDILRCPKCYLIPLISINYSQKEPILQFKCLNNHEINKPLKELYFESKRYQINSIKCQNCEENKISKLFYCIKCYGFYCENEKHSLVEGHNILIPVSKIDFCCFEKNHQKNNVTYYCKTHNKNICNFCKNEEHEIDEIVEFEYLKQNEIEIIKNNIEKTEEKFNLFSNKFKLSITYFQKLINEIINEFNIFKENNELEIKLSRFNQYL